MRNSIPPDTDHGIRQEARDWLVLLGSGNAGEDDLEHFRIWQAQSADHERVFKEERDAWREIGLLTAQNFVTAQPVPGMSRRAFLKTGAMAATLGAVALTGPEILLRLQADHRTAVGGRADLNLPDGSLAQMNTATALALNFAENIRGISLLRGEVFLDVPEQLQAFDLRAGEARVIAAGGQFSYRFDGGRAQLVNLSGDLRLYPDAAREFVVSPAPGEQIAWQDGIRPASPQPVNADVALAWRDGNIIFDSTPFPQAVRELNRYLPDYIVLRGRAQQNRAVSGSFLIADADTALQALAGTLELDVSGIPGVVLVIS